MELRLRLLRESQMTDKQKFREFSATFAQTLNLERAWAESALANPFKSFQENEEFQEIFKEEIDAVIGMYNMLPVSILKMPLLKIISDEHAKNNEKTAAVKALMDKNWSVIEEKADTVGDLITGLKGENIIPFPKEKTGT